MKQSAAPACPRCNRNDEVRKVAYEIARMDSSDHAVRDGYMLDGTVVRPDSSDWYCGAYAESFGTRRVYWGRPLTDRTQ